MSQQPAPLDPFKYYAFISYSSKDSSEAVWLHRALERYTVPPRLVGARTPVGLVPKRIYPIFRDRDELPTTSDLPLGIKTALRESGALVVLCSPNSAKSDWVNEEILEFKRLGRSGWIRPVIIDGVPHAERSGYPTDRECFPPALIRALGAYNELGAESVEPLAADLRGDGDGRRLAKLKLVAGILGLGLEELRRRDLERQRALALRWVGTAAVVALMFAGLALYATFQRMTAERERDKAYVTQSRFLAAKSLEVLADGNFDLATSIALAALPDPSNGKVRPLVGEAEAALAKSLWSDRIVSRLDKGEAAARLRINSADGKRVIFAGPSRIWAYDIEAGTTTWERDGNGILAISQSADDEVVSYTQADGTIGCLSAKTGKVQRLWRSRERYFSTYLNRDGSRLYATGTKRNVDVWDARMGAQTGRVNVSGPVRSVFERDSVGIIVHQSGDGLAILPIERPENAFVLDRSAYAKAIRALSLAVGVKGDPIDEAPTAALGVAIDERLGTVYAVEPSPEGHRVVSVDVLTGAKRALADVGGVPNPVLALSADGDVLAIGSSAGEMTLVDLDGRRAVARAKVDDSQILSLSFAAKNNRIVLVETAAAVFATKWQPQRTDAFVTRRLRSKESVESVDFFRASARAALSPDGEHVIALHDQDGKWTLTALPWAFVDASKPVTFALSDRGNKETIQSISVVAHDDLAVLVLSTGRVLLISLLEGLRAEMHLDAPTGSVGWAAENRILWAASERGAVVAWSTRKTPIVLEAKRLEGAMVSGEGLAVTPDGARALTVSSTGATTLWDGPSGQRLKDYRKGYWRICPAASSLATRTVAIGPLGGPCHLLEMAKGSLSPPLMGEALAFSRDGRTVAVAGNKVLSIVSQRTLKNIHDVAPLPADWQQRVGGMPVVKFAPAGESALGVLFAKDGSRAGVRLWQRNDLPIDLSAGNGITLEDYDWASDGKSVVAGFSDGQLIRVDIAARRIARCTSPAAGGVDRVVRGPGGAFLLQFEGRPKTAASLWEAHAQCPNPAFAAEDRVLWVALDPSTRRLAIGERKRVQVHDTVKKKSTAGSTWKGSEWLSSFVGAKGNQAVFAKDGVAILRRVADGAELKRTSIGPWADRVGVELVGGSGDSGTLLWQRDRDFFVHDLSDSAPSPSRIAMSAPIVQAALSQDGESVVAKSLDGRFGLFDKRGVSLGSWMSPETPALTLDMAPLLSDDGKLAITAHTDGSLRAVDLDTGVERILASGTKGLRHLMLAGNALAVSAIAPDGSALVVSTKDAKPARRYRVPGSQQMHCFVLKRDGDGGVGCGADGALWSFQDDARPRRTILSSKPIVVAVEDPENSDWFAADSEGQIFVVAGGKEVGKLPAARGTITSLTVARPSGDDSAPSKPILVAASDSGLLFGFDPQLQQIVWSTSLSGQMSEYATREVTPASQGERLWVRAVPRSPEELRDKMTTASFENWRSFLGQALSEVHIVETRSGTIIGRLDRQIGEMTSQYRIAAESPVVFLVEEFPRPDHPVRVLRLQPVALRHGAALREEAIKRFGRRALTPLERRALFLE